MKKFKDVSIAAKLAAGFGIMILFMVLIGYKGYRSINDIERNLDEIFSVRLPSIDYLLETDRDLHQLLVSERSTIFENAKSDLFKGLIADYEENLNQSEERWEKYKDLTTTAQELEIIPKYEKAREEWKEISRKVVEGRKADTREGRREALDLTLGTANEKFEEMRNYLDLLTEINLGIANDAHEMALETHRKIVIELLGILGIGLLLAIFFGWIISTGISKPISGAVAGLRDIAEGEGDLTQRLEINPDETTADLKFTVERVNCVGTCAQGPMVLIDGDYFGTMSSDKVEPMLKKYN